ncbi:MAG: fasciclin domain-containing protein [Myxococcota bacterium]|nr:fasciclin domain-containing protein [Myxococcota bacterium]
MNSVLRTFVLVPSVLSILTVAGCGGAENDIQATTPTSAHAQSDIVETAASAGSFKTLVAAIKAADLVDTLKGPGPFTVFAPTDEAFAKLPAGTLDSLLKPENKAKLQSILTYHVVSGRVGSDQVVHLTSAKTVQGKDLKISQNAGTVMVDGAKVVKADIACSNGIIHVIDAVVLP